MRLICGRRRRGRRRCRCRRRGRRARGAGAEHASVRERDRVQEAGGRAVLHRIRDDRHRVTGFEHRRLPPLARQRVRAAALEAPVGRLAVRSGHDHLNPRVWIRPLEVLDRAVQRDALLGLEHRGRMVGACGPRRGNGRGHGDRDAIAISDRVRPTRIRFMVPPSSSGGARRARDCFVNGARASTWPCRIDPRRRAERTVSCHPANRRTRPLQCRRVRNTMRAR